MTAATGTLTKATSKLADVAKHPIAIKPKVETFAIERLRQKMTTIASRPLVVRTHVNTLALDRFRARAGVWGGRIGRLIGIGVGAAFASAVTIPAILARAALDAGMKLDKGFGDKVKGITGKLSASFNTFLLKVGKAGVFDFVIAQLTRLSAWVDKISKNGQLDAWAKRVAASIVAIGATLASVDWSNVASDVVSIAKAIGKVVSVASALGGGGVGGFFNIAVVAVIGKISIGLYGLATALGVVSIAGAPLWLVVGVIAAIAAGAFLLWRNWDTVTAAVGAAWDWLVGKISGAVQSILATITTLWSDAKKAFLDGVNAIWNALPAWFRGALTGAGFVIKAALNPVGTIKSLTAPLPAQAPRAATGRASSPLAVGPTGARQAAPAPGKVAVQIELKGSGAQHANVQQVSATGNVTASVHRGYAMGAHL